MKIIAPIVAEFEKICSSIPWAVKYYTSLYTEVLDREIAIAGITGKDTVLNIGCGAIPFSAIYIAQTTGAHVHAVDIDQDALNCASACISRLGLSSSITFECGAGEEIISPGCTVALVALQARPKDAIYHNIITHCAPGVRIVFRKARAHLVHQYDSLPRGIRAVQEVAQDMKTFGSSVLYIPSA